MPAEPPPPLTAESLWHRRWYAVPNDEVGGWSVATVDRPTSQIDPVTTRDRVLADVVWEEHARWLADLHNAAPRAPRPPPPQPDAATARADALLVAYAELHELVRRFLAGEASARTLRRRHADVEDDLRRALPTLGAPDAPTREDE